MKRRILSLLAAAGLVVACSDSSYSSQTASADTACTYFAQGVCDALSRCEPFDTRITFGNVDACVARYASVCKVTAALPSSGMTADQLSSCSDAMKTITCTDLFSFGTTKACPPVVGKAASGAACSDSTQCASTFCARKDAKTACGTCAAPPQEGDACAGGACAVGLVCSSAGKCRTPSAAGEACSVDTDCQTALYCNQGKCGPGANLGEPCVSPVASGPHCDKLAALWCNISSKKCETGTTAAVGAACGVTPGGGFAFCEAGAYCNTSDAAKFTGTCTARPADGAACTDTSLVGNGPCESGARCDNGTCRLPDATCK